MVRHSRFLLVLMCIALKEMWLSDREAYSMRGVINTDPLG